MDRELNVLVIEDDEVVCKCFENQSEMMERISIVACTNDSEKAIEHVKEYLPDAIILDLELDKGKGNGIDFLNALKRLDLPYKPFIIVTTNNSSKITKEIVRSMGIDFYFSKHQTDYSEKGILEFLDSMKDNIQEMINKVDKSYNVVDSAKKREKHLKALVVKELELVGISPKAKGFNYLIDAIFLLINGEQRSLTIVVGEIYGKTSSSVERAMQNAIDRAWKVNDTEELLKYYTARIDVRRGAPTLTEFVYYYAKKIGDVL